MLELLAEQREGLAYPVEEGLFLVLEPPVGSCWLMFLSRGQIFRFFDASYVSLHFYDEF